MKVKSGLFIVTLTMSLSVSWTQQKTNYLIRYVNPLIGTEKMGHTYPGATVPFGAVQLSPDTDTIPYAVNGKYNVAEPNYYKVKLENGKAFSIQAVNQNEKNVYVEKVLLNGKPLNRTYITHAEIMKGESLMFYMSSSPATLAKGK